MTAVLVSPSLSLSQFFFICLLFRFCLSSLELLLVMYQLVFTNVS